MRLPALFIIVPCYDEQEALPASSPAILEELSLMIREGKLSGESRVLSVDDGNRDNTWAAISQMARTDRHCTGIRLSRNFCHKSALLAGLMEARDRCDITITIDCDGQDDVGAMSGMADAYLDGYDFVYGVRRNRTSDIFFKRLTVEGFYRLLGIMGG